MISGGKSPIISGFFAESNLQFRGVYKFSPCCSNSTDVRISDMNSPDVNTRTN